jgi:hypothetical protein
LYAEVAGIGEMSHTVSRDAVDSPCHSQFERKLIIWVTQRWPHVKEDPDLASEEAKGIDD